MVSQRQIAKMLNMTQQAVSAALRPMGDNETSRVAPETRKLVLETAERLGYRANRYASVLKSGKSGLIGILSGSFAYHWVVERMGFVANEITRHGYIPWPFDVGGYLRREKETIDLLLDSKVEGAVLSWGVHPNIATALREAKIPIISYEGSRFADTTWIGPDKSHGYHHLVLHLIEEGCENILVCRPQTRKRYENRPGQEVMIEALAGYLSGMAAAGREPDPEPLVFVADGSPEYGMAGMMEDYQTGYHLVLQALPRKPDALLFPNDSMALGAMCACRDHGLRIPEDICITGLNNEPQSLFSWIPITTLRQPTPEMAREAVSLLLEGIRRKGSQKSPMVPHYPCELIIRESSSRRSKPPLDILRPTIDAIFPSLHS